ncbi:class I SAM-dependent methyltransferase [Roseofilum capinflatum]|uniref:Class I SAM-dependent methyltransferase n=1 Tax=Roseofilum capinflatum BLCC-M114 TaxID=3022440 RepID=A0ABT7BAA9_9CYAN|nr:class I SAM-dependent methyltransferase [Roseofilum capinflatum]MDJ1176030.1 class I SAM-dependent methyltransferase [Roseofilum capinflatum BLCC-M114]
MADLQEYLQWVTSQSLEAKKDWYSSVAEAYDRTRPRYPKILLDRALDWGVLSSDSRVLEIGCGPGTLTFDLREITDSIVAIEPSMAAYEMARKKGERVANVRFVNSTFEEWNPQGERFDAVVAASCFHWISPEGRDRKIVECLHPHGYLILLWNSPPRPEPKVCHILDRIYERYDRALSHFNHLDDHQRSLDQLGETLRNSEVFDHFQCDRAIGDRPYTIDSYLGLLSTLSPYIVMEPQKRDRLFAEIQHSLQAQGIEQFHTSYLSVIQVVSLKS